MNPNAGPPPEFLAGMIVCIGIVFVVVIGIQVLFLLNLHRTLAVCAERNREMAPGLVWLTLIPLFGTIWAVIMVPKISESLRREYEDRGRRTDGEGFAYMAGVIWAWGGALSILLSIIQYSLQFAGQMELSMLVSLVSLPVSIGILIGWIMFWVQTYGYRKQLERGGRGYQSGTEEDYDDRYDRPRRGDDEDDRPRRRDDDEIDRNRRRDGYDD